MHPLQACFVGSHLVAWLVQEGVCKDKAAAVSLGKRMQIFGFIKHVCDDHVYATCVFQAPPIVLPRFLFSQSCFHAFFYRMRGITCQWSSSMPNPGNCITCQWSSSMSNPGNSARGVTQMVFFVLCCLLFGVWCLWCNGAMMCVQV